MNENFMKFKDFFKNIFKKLFKFLFDSFEKSDDEIIIMIIIIFQQLQYDFDSLTILRECKNKTVILICFFFIVSL